VVSRTLAPPKASSSRLRSRALNGVRSGVARHAPHLVERGLGCLDDAQAAVDAAQYADDQAGGAAVEGADVRGDLIADDGELGERGVQHLPLQVRVAVQCVSQARGQEQQQREHRHEPVVGDLRGEVGALIVAELVQHRQRQPRPAVPPLVIIGPAHHAHSSSSVPYRAGPRGQRSLLSGQAGS
jgi:hypothetical protein